MANKRARELLRQFREDTANGISELQRDETDAWHDDQSALTVVYANTPDAVIYLLEQELSARGLSLIVSQDVVYES